MRGSKWQSTFFVLMTTITVASFFSISLVRQAVYQTIQSESRSILGSDLMIQGKKPLDSLDSHLKGAQIKEVARVAEFRSMARLKQGEETSFVQIVALEPSYPFYGNVEISPDNSWQRLNESGVALVDKQLIVRHSLSIGDEIALGEGNFKIIGSVSLLPGDSSLRAMIAPRVYIPYQDIEKTALNITGSWASHKRHVKFKTTLQEIPEEISNIVKEEKLRVRTPQSKENRISKTVDTVYLFLSLVTLTAAILATIGIVTSMQSHAQANRKNIAVLRCLGATKVAILSSSIWQSLIIGAVGLLLGLFLGWQVAVILLSTLANFFAFSPTIDISILVLLQGTAIASTVSFSSFLIFHSEWQSFNPTEAFRLGQGAEPNEKRNSFLLLKIVTLCMMTYGVIIAGADLILYAALLAILVIVSILLLSSTLLENIISKLNLRKFSFSTRYGMRNLKRSSSLSQLLLLSLGLSLSLAITTVIIADSFNKFLQVSNDKTQPNTVLFDIQNDQLQIARKVINDLELQVLEEAPMVSMYLTEINGKPVSELMAHSLEGNQWAYRREYKSSYRDSLKRKEKLLAGNFVNHFEGQLDEEIPVTLEEGIAETLNVWLEDKLVFDVQGLKIKTKVVGIREVNWREMSPNVFVLFPPGVLENAPQMHVFSTHIESEEQLALLSRTAADAIPNVSIIDIRAILKVITTVSESALFAVMLLSIFLLAIAILCIIQGIVSSAKAHTNEDKTLFTLGARLKEIRKIRTVEVTTLSLISAITGLVLGAINGGLVVKYLLKMSPVFDFTKLLLVVAFAVTIAVVTSKLTKSNVSP